MAYQLRNNNDMAKILKNNFKIFLIIFFSFLSTQFTFATVANQGGYTNKLSVFNGDILKFYISTSSNNYNLKIYKLGKNSGLVFTSPNITGGLQSFPSDAYKNGCNWNESYELVIPDNWEPGVYSAVFPVSNSYYENNGEIIFAVKTNNLGSYSKIGVILTVNTWQAYNNFGGKSLYQYNSTNSNKSSKVSFDRPFTTNAQYDFHSWAEHLVDWLNVNNTDVEYITNLDLYENPNVLSNYDVIIDVGHDEYTSLQERTQMENFVSNGGKIMFLSGNNYWWQVRFENNNRTMVCYKDPSKDPMFGVDNSIVTTNWFDYPLNKPENKLTGTSFREGGFVNDDSGYYPKSQGYGDYAAFNTHSWVYKNVNINEGVEFGFNASIVGYEVDGNEFTWNNGIPLVTGTDQTPTNFQILGISPAYNTDGYSNGHAIMGIYYLSSGGAVFNASTTNWAFGLPSDSVVQKVTGNVLNQFLKNSFPPEIKSWSPGETVSKRINHESVYINDRYNITLSDATLNFHIDAVDPRGETINYVWKINDAEVNNSNSSDIIFYNNMPSGIYNVTAFAYNSTDTSEISWKVTTNSPVNFYSLSGNVTYDNNASYPLQNVTLILTPVDSSYTINSTTDNNGNYTFNNVQSGNYFLSAVSNSQFPDNYVNATDALQVARYFAGLKTFNSLRQIAADVDDKGGVNATDALLIIRRFGKFISSFTKPDWVFETKQITVTNSNITSVNLKGIASGDVDGSAVGPF